MGMASLDGMTRGRRRRGDGAKKNAAGEAAAH
jgi:hypothetical protein